MCAACIEYTKDKLTVDEFKSALKEMTLESKQHVEAVQKLVRELASKPDQLKKELKNLTD